ncbi:SA1362 family protein [Priestia koreensis]|uniref:Uncharacterized protein n=1 Tax=Priestia koreensis TaxID=284581 RepID=A0A0M0L004_9BACI|nr:SA1362 family protein [Priestia koreensis]KOO43953.1 hypothetical protein AMD01_14600 [Priestia koreensis]
MRRSAKPIVYVLITLGIFGLLASVITHPAQLMRQLLYMGIFAGIIYVLYRFVFRSPQSTTQDRQYLRAVKQSKHRSKTKSPAKGKPSARIHSVSGSSKGQSSSKTLKKKRSNTHLTVIEGKKGKKKNRAFF